MLEVLEVADLLGPASSGEVRATDRTKADSSRRQEPKLTPFEAERNDLVRWVLSAGESGSTSSTGGSPTLSGVPATSAVTSRTSS